MVFTHRPFTHRPLAVLPHLLQLVPELWSIRNLCPFHPLVDLLPAVPRLRRFEPIDHLPPVVHCLVPHSCFRVAPPASIRVQLIPQPLGISLDQARLETSPPLSGHGLLLKRALVIIVPRLLVIVQHRLRFLVSVIVLDRHLFKLLQRVRVRCRGAELELLKLLQHVLFLCQGAEHALFFFFFELAGLRKQSSPADPRVEKFPPQALVEHGGRWRVEIFLPLESPLEELVAGRFRILTHNHILDDPWRR